MPIKKRVKIVEDHCSLCSNVKRVGYVKLRFSVYSIDHLQNVILTRILRVFSARRRQKNFMRRFSDSLRRRDRYFECLECERYFLQSVLVNKTVNEIAADLFARVVVWVTRTDDHSARLPFALDSLVAFCNGHIISPSLIGHSSYSHNMMT